MNILAALLAASLPLQAAEPAPETAPPAQVQAPKTDDSLAPEKAPPAAAEACCPCPAKEDELTGCSQHLQEMAQAYKDGYEKMQAWAKQASGWVVSLQQKEEELKAKIQENEAAITKLKFSKTKASQAKLKELQAQTQDLWKELHDIEKKSAAVCATIAKGTRQQVKDIAEALGKRFELVQDKLHQ
ncbi:MAG TPA: hypothetical protein DCM05_03395 [Elusimicrobia bacterium]|nr:hypothetical protein [Elusimicrobiota bacterium]